MNKYDEDSYEDFLDRAVEMAHEAREDIIRQEEESQVCPHADCGYGECSGRWVNGACETHGNNEGKCQKEKSHG